MPASGCLAHYPSHADTPQTMDLSAGGAEGTRTPDIRLAKAALSQLSYGPGWALVGHSGLEPETSVLSGLRSNQLS